MTVCRLALTVLALVVPVTAAPSALADVEPHNDSPLTAEPLPGVAVTGVISDTDVDYYALAADRTVEVNITTAPTCATASLTDQYLRPAFNHGPSVPVRFLVVRAKRWDQACKNIAPTSYSLKLDATGWLPPYALDPTALRGVGSGMASAVNVDARPNDSQETAVPITSGVYYEGVAGPSDDDWMTFIATGESAIRWVITQLGSPSCGPPEVGAPYVEFVTINPARRPTWSGYQVWSPVGETTLVPSVLAQPFDSGVRGFVRVTSTRAGCRWLLYVITALAPASAAVQQQPTAVPPASAPPGPSG